MADKNIIEKGVSWFEEKVDDAADFLEEKAKEYKINQIKDDYIDSFKNAVVTHDKLTPELIKQGWRIGLDGQPYNHSLVGIHDPGGKFYDPDANRNEAADVAAAVESTASGVEPFTNPLIPQDLRQRTPSGTMYEPDLSDYRASSLFDYAGPGGLEEYTYGQGLPTEGAGYGIWGTPTDVPNPYYSGQFGEGYVEPETNEIIGGVVDGGIADGAISLPPIDLPEGVSPTNNNPNVGTNTTNINVGGYSGNDLDYFQTLASMGIDPKDAPSTQFPGVNAGSSLETSPYDSGMTWMGGADMASSVYGKAGYTNDGNLSARDQWLFNLARMEQEGDTIGKAGYTNDGTTSARDQALFNLARIEQERDTIGKSGYTNDGTTSARDNALFNLARMEQEKGTTGLLDYENDGTTSARDQALFQLARMEQERDTIGKAGYTNDGNLSARDEALFQLARMEQERDTIGKAGYTNDGTTSARDEALFNLARIEQEKGTTGLMDYDNDGNLSARDEALFQLARMEQEKGTTGLMDYDNDGTTGTADLEIFNKARLERFSPTGGANIYRTEYTDNYQPKVITDHKDDVISGGTYEGVDSDELEPYRGMYLPDDGLNINLPQGPVGTVFAQFNKPTTWDNPDAFESDGFNMVTVTDTPYKTNNEINLKNVDALQGPVGSTKLNPNEIWFNDKPLNLSTGNYRNGNNHNKHLFDIRFTSNDNNDYVPTEQYGIDEAVVDASKYIKEKAGDAYKYATNLFSSDNADTNGEPSIWKPSQLGQINANLYGTSPGWGNMRIWENPPEPDYGGMTMPPSLQEGGDKEGAEEYALMEKTAREIAAMNKVQYDSALKSDKVTSSFPLDNSLSNSLIKREIEKIEKRDLSNKVSQNLSKIAERRLATPVTYTSYGPPNMQRVGGRYGF